MLGYLNVEREVEYSDVASCPLAWTSTSQDCTNIATCLRSYDTYLAFPEGPSLKVIARQYHQLALVRTGVPLRCGDRT